MKLPGTPESRRFAAMVGVFVAAGVAVTGLLLPPAPIDPQKEALPVIHVAGVPLPAEGDAVANALDLVRRYAAGELAIVLPDGTERKVKRGALGAEIDRVRLAEFVREARRPGSAIWRAHRDKNPNGPIEVPLPVSIDAEAAVQKLLDLKGQLDAPAVDAFVDLQERKLRPEKLGHRLDVYGTLARLDAALRLGQDKVEAVVETVQPRLLASALGNVRFDQVLGYFETRYSQGGKYKERTYNLRLAASKLDGAVVMPGEIFDFNGVVGPRDEANGYRVAPVIAQGEVVDGLGGGTCQISGTLHGAAFFAGMEITERYPHSRPSYYIKLGLDATVVYPTINFRFKNPFDYPGVLHQTVRNGVVRAA
ncbi:MAG: VanW family protein, partial [Polyangiaceae bacterium]